MYNAVAEAVEISVTIRISFGSMSIVGVTRKNRIYDNYKRQRIILSLIF